MGRQSWFVKVTYYPNIRGCRFSKGWIKFMEECKVEIGGEDPLHFLNKWRLSIIIVLK